MTLRWVWLGEMGNRASAWLPGALNARLRRADFVLGWWGGGGGGQGSVYWRWCNQPGRPEG